MLIPKISITKKHLLLFLIVLGSMMVTGGLFLISYQKAILSFRKVPEKAATLGTEDTKPKRIIMQNLGIDTTIEEGTIFKGIWQTSDKGASHLDTSASPGGRGNIVIYGHNRKNIFIDLPNMTVGNVIKIITGDGHIYSYKVVSTETVKPDYGKPIEPTDHEILTVYTCNGFLDTTRFIVQAIPVESN